MASVTEAAEITLGDTVVIQGLGLLGLYGCAMAKARGARLVIGLDAVEDRLVTAKKFGADHVINATEAAAVGLVNKVVPDAEFDDARQQWVAEIAGKSPLLLGMGKRALAATRDLPLESALDYLQAQLALAFTTDDLAEGVLAFKEKRSPHWHNT